MRGIRATMFTLASWAILMGPAVAADGPDGSYKLGPRDQLRIKVYDWRTGEMHEWTALTGAFAVDASGNVSLPLVGDIAASGQTTSQLAQALADRLKAKIGLAQRPDASIEVVTYRPFYILGQVEKPGEYEYRPGMTVLQAASIAGGLARTPQVNMLDFERDSIVQRGELRVLATSRQALIARQARLDAQVKGADSIAFPDTILSQKNDPEISRVMREEQQLFDTDRNALKSQTESLGQARILLEHEVETLEAKETSMERQLSLAQKELAQVSGLVSKGLAAVPRQLQIEQNTSQFESNRLDIQLSALRARQDIAKIDRDSLDLHDKQRMQYLVEAREVRTSLDSIKERIATAESLIYQSEVRSPRVTIDRNRNSRLAPIYSVTRKNGDGYQTETVGEDDQVEPSDTIRVEWPALGTDTTDLGTGAEQTLRAADADRSPVAITGN